jgi:hypothetical protein
MVPISHFTLAILLCVSGAPGARAQDSLVRWELPAAEAEVGEPVRARLVAEHPASVRPSLPPLGLDDSWVVFEGRPAWTEALAQDAGRATTTWEFRFASLESGERALPELVLSLGDARVDVPAARLAFRGVLAEGEDAPRPVKGLPELPPEPARGALAWWIAGAAVAVAALAAFRLARRARRAPVAAVPAPSARLAVLEAEPLASAADVQTAHFALTRLLRESADLRAGRDRSALTDEEWSDAARGEFDAAGLGAAERAALEALFAKASAVKYGPERPTHWATREALASARSLAARLEPPARGRGKEAAA